MSSKERKGKFFKKFFIALRYSLIGCRGAMKKKHLAVEPMGLVKSSGLSPLAVLERLEVADMWNCHIPSLLGPLVGPEQGNVGRAEVVSPVDWGTLQQELETQGWAFAPVGLFLCGKIADGRWVFPQLGQDFTVLNAPKRFPGRDDFYPWMHTAQGVRALGLTPRSDIFTEAGEVQAGIRFPVVKIGK